MLSTTTLLSLLLAGVTSVRAHGHVVSWNVNGQDHAGFNPSWPPEYGPTAERPTDNADQGWANQWTDQVACGGYGSGENLQTWDVTEGGSITATWDQWPEGHKGPVMEYMARCPDSGCDGVSAASLNWFKISEVGWNGHEWGSDKIHQTHRWTFNVPTGLAAGNYLVRHEIIAMHEVGAPQIYPVCFQARLASSGSAIPSDTVTFPAAYNQNDDFRRFNLYWGDDFNAFKNPGPAVWNGQGGGAAPAPAPAPSSGSPTSSAAGGASSSSSGNGGGNGNGGGDYGNGGDYEEEAPASPSTPQESPSRSLVTSNAMATGKRPGKFCRRRQSNAARDLISDEALAARKLAYGKRQHVVNRYSKRSIRH